VEIDVHRIGVSAWAWRISLPSCCGHGAVTICRVPAGEMRGMATIRFVFTAACIVMLALLLPSP
jgi:hypothetical protein